jgi:hypothetical protein
VKAVFVLVPAILRIINGVMAKTPDRKKREGCGGGHQAAFEMILRLCVRKECG